MRARRLVSLVPLSLLALAPARAGALTLSECTTAYLEALFAAPPACPVNAATTIVTTQAGFDAWAMSPTTHLDLRAVVNFPAGSFLSTACDVTVGGTGGLVSAADLGFRAKTMTVRGDLLAGQNSAGDLVLGASALVDMRSSAKLAAGGIAISTPAADISADADAYDTSYCLVGGALVMSGYSSNTAYQAFLVQGQTLDIGADFHAEAQSRLEADGDLVVRSSAFLRSDGRIFAVAGGLLDLRGSFLGADLEMFAASADVAGSSSLTAFGNINVVADTLLDTYGHMSATGAIQLYGDDVILRAAARVWPESSAYVSASGLLDLRGDIEGAGDVTLSVGQLTTSIDGEITDCGYVDISVDGHFDHRGEIEFDDDVFIDASTYRLYGSHALSASYDCVISGAKDPKSVPASGCVEVP